MSLLETVISIFNTNTPTFDPSHLPIAIHTSTNATDLQTIVHDLVTFQLQFEYGKEVQTCK
jgi:hypothetical protein